MSSLESSSDSDASNSDAVTPLPTKDVTVVGLVVAAGVVTSIQMAVFLVFLVETFVDDSSSVGLYVGIVGSAFSVGELLASFGWGVFGDKLGRKPLLLVGSFGTALMQPVYGVASSVATATVFQFLNGLVSTNEMGSKAFLGDLLDDSNQAKGFALSSVITVPAMFVGPLIGGYLYDPTDNFDGLRDSEFLAKYPQFLPCAVSSLVCLVAGLGGMWALREPQRSKSGVGRAAVLLRDGDMGDALLHEDSLTTVAHDSAVSQAWELLKQDVAFRWLCVLNVLMQMWVTGQGALFPVWAQVSEDEGGWELEASDVGLIMAVGALGVVVGGGVFHMLVKKFTLLRFGVISFVPMLLLFASWPLIARIQGSGQTVFFLITQPVLIMPGAVFANLIYSLLITNCVPRQLLGRANGIAHMTLSMGRILGALVYPAVFSWGLSRELASDKSLVFGRYSAYYLLCVTIAACIAILLALPGRLNARLPEEHQELCVNTVTDQEAGKQDIDSAVTVL